ncbi:MAG: hypothetical protein GY696_00685 [Gammaproteobacteria bacterium]|nr:hypothetical protein [Gammaproteobacteria bacterium]
MKSAFMVRSLATAAVNSEMPILLTINDVPIRQQRKLKYLGVTIDADLSFVSHAELTAPKIKRGIGCLWKSLGKYASQETFTKIYRMKILPLLLFSFSSVMPVQAQHWKQIEKINRFAARLAANDFISPYESLLNRLRWKPIAQIAFERQMVSKLATGARYFPQEALRPKPPQFVLSGAKTPIRSSWSWWIRSS